MEYATNQSKPAWAGEDDWISRLVNRLIAIGPLFRLMQHQARKVIIRTAEKNGIPWRQEVARLAAEIAPDALDRLTNPALVYPAYYTVPFHAYDRGNLCWLAAYEAPSATYAMALRVWKNETLTPQIAQDRLRGGFFDVLDRHLPARVGEVLDVGCSVGISTQTLHQHLSQRQGSAPRTIGLDLSPYMLAVAEAEDKEKNIAQWVHGVAENTDFPEASFDLITLQFVLHELPQQATHDIFREMLRILRPGGCLAIVDNNPRSPVLQSLPPVLFTLMKSTEPWTDEYYTFDVVAALETLGFDSVELVPSDPRHRAILAHKPKI